MSSPFQKKFCGKSPFAMHEGKPHKSLEHQAEEYLGFPQEKARQRTDEYLNIVPCGLDNKKITSVYAERKIIPKNFEDKLINILIKNINSI